MFLFEYSLWYFEHREQTIQYKPLQGTHLGTIPVERHLTFVFTTTKKLGGPMWRVSHYNSPKYSDTLLQTSPFRGIHFSVLLRPLICFIEFFEL
jgi:hypothetical protein